MKLCRQHKLGVETKSTSTTLLVEFHHCMDFVNLHCCGGGEKERFQLPFKRDLETSDHLLCPKGRPGTFVKNIPWPSGARPAEM